MSGPQSPDQARTLRHRLGTAIRNQPFVVAVVGVMATLILGLVVLTPRYETNDDVTMHWIVAGKVFTDRPDEHFLFSNVLLGLALRWLYENAPNVPWYPLNQILTLAASATAICYALLRVNPTIRQAMVCVLFLAVAILPCLAELQFTKTAFLATLAGLLLVLAPLRGAPSRARTADVASFLLLIVGSLIRFESFVMAAIVVMPLALVATYSAPALAARRALPVIAAAVLATGLYWVNQEYYARDPEWKDFYAYNAVRAEFTDYNHFSYNEKSAPAFRAAGWAPVDFGMLVNWCYADRDLYSLKRMRQIVATAPRNRPIPPMEMLKSLLSNVGAFPQLVIIFLAVPCGACLGGSGWKQLVLPALFWTYGIVLAAILASFFWMPARVAVPIFAGVLAICSLRPERQEHGKLASSDPTTDKVIQSLAGAMAGVLMLWSTAGLAIELDHMNQSHDDMKRAMAAIKPKQDQLYVLWREWFPLERLFYPLDNTRDLQDFRCLSFGVLLPTPFTDRRLSDFAITDIYRAFWEQPNVYLIAVPQLLTYFQIYVDLHYHVKLLSRVVFTSVTPPRFLPPNAKPSSPPAAKPYTFFVYQLKEDRGHPPEQPMNPPR
jgi:hypothetical protein